MLRTWSYIANMSQLAGLALASSSSRKQAPILRSFLQRYVTHRVYFGVLMVCVEKLLINQRTTEFLAQGL